MRKTKLYGIWHRVRNLSLLAIITAFVISAAISVIALRSNNTKTTKLRQAVYTADQQNGDINSALNNLRKYVYGHMNTNLRAGSASNEPPIQLVNQFNRDLAAERQRIANGAAADKVYVEAQTVCEKAGTPIPERAQCIQDYVTANGKGIPQLNLPAKEVYTFDFASPVWSPDIAGWSLVVTFILGLLFIARLMAGLIIKKYLKR